MTAQTSSSVLSYEHQEHILHVYYTRLREIDENNRDLTSLFFAINSAILVVVFEILKADWQRLILAIIGYCASVALTLIGYKSYWAWKAYYRDLRKLEDALGYNISQKYETQLRGSPAAAIRVTLIRLRFSFIFLILWLFTFSYFVLMIPAPWPLHPTWLLWPLGVLFIIVIACLPWVYLLGSLQASVLLAIWRAPWTPEV